MTDLKGVIGPCPIKRLGCATAIGAWGDAIAAMGNAFSILDRLGQEKCDFLYYGFDPSLADFLRLQPRIGTVSHITPPSYELYYQTYLTAFWSGLPPVHWLWEIIGDTPFSITDIFPTHMDRDCQTSPYAPQYWHGAVLPESATDWAKNIKSQAPGPLYLFNPTSTHSSPLAAHWPHWKEALDWLLNNYPYTFALVSLEDSLGVIDHPRLMNLIGKTPSMMHVLALTRECDGVFTTSNSLSMWSAIDKKMSVVALHHDIYHKNALYYKNWVSHQYNLAVDYTDGLEAFQSQAKKLFSLNKKNKEGDNNE